MSINALLTALADELAADGVADPLTESLTLAFVWADLARLAGETAPAEVAALLDAPVEISARCVPGSYPCEACGRPSGEDVLDSETCVALCEVCRVADAEYARAAW